MHGAGSCRLPSVRFSAFFSYSRNSYTLVIGFEMNLSELRFRVAANKLMRNTPKKSCNFVVRNIELK
jgi:hypothetical protein